MNIVIIKR